MTTRLQFRRGNTATSNSITGATGELFIDTDKKTVVVHDGATAGGSPLVTESGTQTISNKTIGSDLLPSADSAYDLGSPSAKWKDLYLSGNTIFLGTLQLSDSGGTLSIRDSSGSLQNGLFANLVVDGDLTVNGSTTTINSTTLDVDDLNITVAKGAADSTAANGAGITVDGANASITYTSSTDTWNLNKPIGTNINVLSNYSTTEVAEGSNLYYTTARADSDAKNAISVNDAGGAGSLTYDAPTGVFTYTGPNEADVRAVFSASGDLQYDSATGVFSIDVEVVYTKTNFDSDLNLALTTAAVTTTDLAEGTNLYYTTARADSDFDVRLATKSTTDVAEGSNLYYTTARFDSDFGDNTTDDLTEGSNLYYTTARADSDAKNAVSATDAGGDGSFSYDAASGVFTYTGPSASEVRAHFSAAGDLAYNSSTGEFSFDVEQVYTKTNFDSDLNVALSTDAVTTTDLTEGDNLYYTTARFDSDFGDNTTDDLAEGSNLYYTTSRANSDFDVRLATKSTADLAEGNNLYYTTARADSDFDVRLATKSTTEFAEGDNLYYTTARFDSDFGDNTTDDLTEGSNLYYTTVRADSDFDVRLATKTTTDLTEGSNLYYTTARADSDFDVRLATKSTTDLTEGDNLYYTTSRADSDFDVRLATKTTTDVAEGSNLYYTTARADSDFDVRLATKSTTDVAEGSNLYYTTARADSDAKNAVSVTDAGGDGSLSYNSSTGVFTYTGPSASEVRAHISGGTGVTITDGSIAIGQAVATTSDVTFAKITGDSAVLDQINLNTSYAGAEHIPFVEGAVWYDNYHKTLNYWGEDSNVIHEIGIEEHQRVYNNTGSLIEKGKPLYFSGNYNPGGGVLPVPTVGLADATDVNAYNAQGLAAGNIANGSYGYVILSGQVDGINTSALSAGNNFFVGLTPGAVQNASPVYPNYPMCLGWVVTSDSSDGVLIVNQQNHSVNSFRVRTFAHIGNDLIVDGNLLVNGTQTITSTENVSIGGSIQYLNAGNTIGEANTVFVGSGLDDAFFTGHYSGDSSSKSFYVKIDATGTPDTFEWGHDSAVGAIATGIAITGAEQILDSDYGISIDFGATTGHTLTDKWTGTAAALDVDTGFFTNRNTGDAGNGYTHLGFFFDVSTNKWRLLDAYDPEPENPINLADSSLSYGDLIVNQVEGNLVGNVTGNVTGNLLGNVTGTVSSIANFTTDNLTEGSTNLYYDSAAVVVASRNSMVGGAGIVYTASTGTIDVGAGSYIIVNANDVAVDATSANTVSKVVARDASGNFSAGTITAALSGNASTATTLQNARNIGGVSFDGSANINLPGVNTTGNQNTTGSAASWTTARTITLGGDLTGNVSLDGTADVILTATVAANSVALGTDTTGNYVASGATSGNGISGSVSSEGGTFTVTSNATNANTGSTIVFRDGSGNFSAGTVTAALSGNASTATTLQTPRNIGGVSFDGSANINLPGVNTAGNQNTTGTAAVSTAATITTSSTASAFKVPFANTTVSTTGSYGLLQDTEATFTYNPSTNTLAAGTFSGALSGNATTATTLQTARAINGVNFNGSAAITITANTPNTLTRGTYLTGNNFDGSAGTTWAVDAATANTASKVVARDASGNFSAGTVTAALSGNATTATTLQTARDIALSGDVTGSASFNGSANISITATVANDAITRAKLASEVELIIYNSAGSAIKTLYGAGS
jgi:hypothetical protein